MINISALAPAKVNLNLHILGSADQGYHYLDSLVVFTDFGDEVHIKKTKKTSYNLKGPYSTGLLMNNDNLILKAHKSLEAMINKSLTCEITLIKNLPSAAGIGGGSSDGATTLKLVNKLFELGITEEKLKETGLSLGADFPVCLHGETCFMSGIGDIITPISYFPKLHIALINPKKTTSTKKVFQLFNNNYSSPLQYSDSFKLENLFSWLSTTHNDLQKPATSLVPEISFILQQLEKISTKYYPILTHYGMSGSGATCYIISPSSSLIHEVEKQFKSYDFWYLEGKIL